MADKRKVVDGAREPKQSDARRLEDERAESLELERRIAERVTRFLPWVVFVGGIVVFFAKGLGLALLVLTAGTLLFAIFHLWWSLRTLAGDAPAPAGFVAVALASEVASLEEEKRAVLRTLKDLEHEHAIGRLSKDDHRDLIETYRDRAKDILKRLDEAETGDGSAMKAAEKLVEKHFAKRALAREEIGTGAAFTNENERAPSDDGNDREESSPLERALSDAAISATPPAPTCPTCNTLNDSDAAFCKKCGARMEAHA